MTEETTIIQKQDGVSVSQDSAFGGVSIRAWLAVMLVFTVCANHLATTTAVLVDAVMRGDWSKVGTFSTVGEPLYSLVLLAVGFYFGQKTQKS